ncbi:Urease accessory protein UreF [Rhodovastum atsumiense]|nr:urease accessory protein UreF [Rhodovastum atsumiense]CAH2599241.1 Urease accessory protein UreF [Rhodovastum atsumiense]
MADTALLRLLSWLSPTFPTGAFAWSHGLEWAVEAGDIHDTSSLRGWLTDLLAHGSARTDAILLRHAHRACRDRMALASVAALGRAVQPSRERLAETVGQGNAFVRAATPWGIDAVTGLGELPYPVAVGALAGTHGIGEDDACAATLQAGIANLISAAVRLVPLGQSAGLSVLAALEPLVLAVAAETRDAMLEDIGSACFRSDLAAMRHETQYTRLFRS